MISDTLDQIAINKKATVVQIEGGWKVRQKLNQMGIHVHDTLVMKRKGRFGGPVLILIHGIEVALGHGMAKKIKVHLNDKET